MKIAVAIITFGRREILSKTLKLLENQTRLPDEVIVCAPDESHTGPRVALPFPARYVYGRTGSCAQRNLTLEHLSPDIDVVVFFDDDFMPASDYLAVAERNFEQNPSWRVLTGVVRFDGINGSGFSFEEGEALLEVLAREPRTEETVTPWHGGYGCNMSVRVSAIGAERFDERLVLYGWQEDVDFTRRVAREGGIIRDSKLKGVHLGAKSGRVNGVKFGYSQVVNPLYLVEKGSMTIVMALNLVARNIIANLARSVWPEDWIDRRGRLRGNLIGLADLLTGRMKPERALEL